MPDRTCSIPGCERKHYGRSWCNAHYGRWRKYGDPLGVSPNARPLGLTEAQAFAWYMPGNPPPADNCWDWTGTVVSTGYGRFTVNRGVPVDAHVASHRLYNPHDSTTTDKPLVLHWCDRRICVQPAHLHAGTASDNMREAVERGRIAFGDRVGGVKLTDAKVIWVRAQTGMTHQEMAARLDVSSGTIGFIRRGETWKHLL